jgi:HAD superfamily hydrolase (TIGR01509 family)
LRIKFKLGIVTGRPRAEAVFVLDRFAMREAFSALVTMDDLPPGRGKPDPLGIRLALAALDVSRAVYVGDTVDDMDAAQAAGISAVAVVRNPDGNKELVRTLRSRGASAVLGDINDILEVV